MKNFCLFALAALLAVPTPSLASDTSEKVSEPAKKSKRVCRKVQLTGSHLLKTICLREEQWSDWEKIRATKTDQSLDTRNNGLQPEGLPN